MRTTALKIGIWLSILALVMVGFWGCTLSQGEGTLKLNLSDAPIDASNVKGVYITINEIQYNLNGEWRTFEEFNGPKAYNLLELSGDNFTLLGDLTLPAGHYTQIRFMLDIPEYGTNPSNPGCYILYTDDTKDALFVPSGGETGYKATGEFTVPVNGTVEVTADFDIRKSVVKAGASGIYILKPVIRLIVNDEAGKITGTITNNSNYSDIIIFAYEDGTWSATKDDDPADGESRFPNAVTSGAMDTEEKYVLALLAAGTYDLVIAGYTDDTFGEVLGFKSDIVVESGATTRLDIDTSALEYGLQISE